MAVEDINSVLVADFGSVNTRLVLIDLVEGQYRLVASSRVRTTAEKPLGNAAIGLERAAQAISEVTGRQLIGRGGSGLLLMPETGGHGADAFLATSSAGRPMRVFLIGLTPEISIASAGRMLAGAYVTIVGLLSPDDLRSEEAQINAMLTSEPDLFLIVGGTDGGADHLVLQMVRKVEMALSLIRRGVMPTVLYAGNRALRAHVKALLQSYTTVFVAKNVRPALHDEHLFPAQIELALAYDEYRSKNPGGFAEVGQYSQVGVVPTTQGTISAVRYMAALPHQGPGPLYVDVGSANSALVAGVHGEAHYTVRTELGVGHHLVNTLKTIRPDRIKRWLPFQVTDEALRDYAHNKELKPTTIPGTAQELMLEQAFAREIIRTLVDSARPAWRAGDGPLLPRFEPIIGAGAVLTEAQHPGISAMLLLDALQPVGHVHLQLDPHNLISALGVVAYLKPLMTVQAMEAGGLLELGSAFCPLGRVRRGRPAMQVQIRQSDGRVIKHTVRGGEIWLAPVLPGVMTEVRLQLRRGLSINGRRRFKQRIVAGAAGIIFDARGRPLAMPRARDRKARFTEWQTAMLGRATAPDDGNVLLLAGLEEAPDAVLS